MRFFGKLALATAMATATATMAMMPTTAAMAKEQKLKNSKGFANAYVAVKEEVDAGDAAGAKAAYEKAIAAIENEDDRYIAGSLGLEVAKLDNDKAVETRALELMMASTSAPADVKGQVALQLAFSAYNAKQYQKAIDYAAQGRQFGSTDPQLDFVSGLSKLSLEDATGFDAMRSAVSGMEASGSEVPEQWYALAATNAQSMKNNQELAYWTLAQVKAYPSPQNWRAALITYQYGPTDIPNSLMTDLFRLRTEAGSLTDPIDYQDYIKSVTLNDQIILPTEAIYWLNNGVETGVLTGSEPYYTEAVASARKGKDADASGFEKREKAAIASNASRQLRSAADVAFDQGRYARAIELYDLAGKAGEDAALIAMRQGIASYKMGDSATARAKFEAINTAPESDLAKYWLIFLDAQQDASAAAPAQ